MDSPVSQQSSSSGSFQRMHPHSHYHSASINHRGAIHKPRTSSLSRTVSASHADRLYQLARDQSNHKDNNHHPVSFLPTTDSWITPQSSPQQQRQHTYCEPGIPPFSGWTIPTPPRSDSGLPVVSVDANEVPVTTGVSAPADFSFDQPTAASSEMSSLGFLLPSQYGSGHIESEPSSYTMEQNYIPPPRPAHPASTGETSAYAQTISSSPSLYQSRSAPHDISGRVQSHGPAYGQNYNRIAGSYDSVSSGDYSMAQNQSIPSISGMSQSPSPHIGSSGSSMMPSYHPNVSRSPSLYDSPAMYGQPFTSAPTSTPLYTHPQSLSYPTPFIASNSNKPTSLSSTSTLTPSDNPLSPNDTSSMRVLNQRPKPQCWDHGCNGRQFSTFSNLLRHQREKSGSAAKSYCPKCGAEFTRTTARNGHLAHDKCTKTTGERRESTEEGK